MHKWILLLLIALLPLRGWAGDSMAGEMLAQQLVGSGGMASLHAIEVGAHRSQEPDQHGHECLEHAQSAAEAAVAHEPVVSDETASCSACVTCQACSSVAIALARHNAPAAAPVPARPAFTHARFASVQPAPGLKPPIS
jgi:hypothetical protein